MVFPRWRQSLARSLHLQRSKPEAKFFQVASINDNKGKLSVENRTVVFRGFVEDSHSLLAITDSRSDKYQQWLENPHTQICWYFTKSREQYRISSTVLLINEAGRVDGEQNQNLRNKVWNDLSNNAKQQFSWPTPKAPLSEQKDHEDFSEGEVPMTFVVIVFKPIFVDYLNLRTEPQTRELHTFDERSDEWSYSAVNP